MRFGRLNEDEAHTESEAKRERGNFEQTLERRPPQGGLGL